MKWKRPIIWTISLAAFLLICGSLALGIIQKPAVSLAVNGKTVAIVKQPFIGPIFADASADVYFGKSKLFSLWKDFFDGPMFIYPFSDGKRFLCDYDDDTAMLDFVVDFRDMTTNVLDSFQWPTDSYVREYLARRATNVVYDTAGSIRLPTCQEIQEVSDYLKGKGTAPIKAGYLSFIPFRDKESMLLDLATNRNNVWPIETPVTPVKN